MARRKLQEINAGSMADIAFLLLIFFLVTTTMESMYGISRKLPPPPDPNNPPPEIKEKKRNILDILVNRNDQIMIEDRQGKLSEIKEEVLKHVTNNGKDPNYAENPKKAVINLTYDRGTSYKAYISVYNEILKAYNEIYNREALRRFGKTYDELSKSQQKEIRKDYPQIIAESTPETR